MTRRYFAFVAWLMTALCGCSIHGPTNPPKVEAPRPVESFVLNEDLWGREAAWRAWLEQSHPGMTLVLVRVSEATNGDMVYVPDHLPPMRLEVFAAFLTAVLPGREVYVYSEWVEDGWPSVPKRRWV